MLKKAVMFLSFFFMFYVGLTLEVKAYAVECYYGENETFKAQFDGDVQYGQYAIFYKDSVIGDEDERYGRYEVNQTRIDRSDFLNSDGTYKCPDRVYVTSNKYEGLTTVFPSFDSTGCSVDCDIFVWHHKYINDSRVDNPYFQEIVNPSDPPAEEPDDNEPSDGHDGNDYSPGQTDPINCEDFNSNGSNLINEVFTIFMIAAPILLIIFGVIDFAKASLASDEQALRNAGINFGKRIIAAVLLFLLPLVINLLIGVAYEVGIFGDAPRPPAECIE